MFENIITNKEIKFNDLEKKIFKFVCMLGCLIIKIILEKQDKKILESIKGDKRFDNRGFKKTTIHTIMGDVQYKRRLYKLTEKGISKYVFLLDEKLHIKPPFEQLNCSHTYFIKTPKLIVRMKGVFLAISNFL